VKVDVLGVLEFNSIAAGIEALDAMAKAAPIRIIQAMTVNPGKFVTIFTGDVAEVDASLSAGKAVGGTTLIDELFLPSADPRLVPALEGRAESPDWDALGIIETYSAVSAIEAADIGVKRARVAIVELRVSPEMGGKGFVKFMGDLHEVEAAMEAGSRRAEAKGLLCRTSLIPRPHPDIRPHVVKESKDA
jgi:microcompartment protein CcmL/EutN